jgi:dipeptidyl aminopeptidase/acylaminoacyl peptidase
VAAAPSADVYGNPPDHDSPLISPDGKFLAVMMPLGENGGVKIINLAGGGNCAVAPSTVKVRNIFWVGPNRLLVHVSFFFTPQNAPDDQRYKYEIFRYISVGADCRNSYDILRDHEDYGWLAGFSYVGRDAGGKYLLFAAYNVRATGVVTDVTSIRMKKRDRSSLDVYRIDGETGKSEPLQPGNPDTIEWIADGAGQLRLRVDEDQYERMRVHARLGDSNAWDMVYDSGSVDPSRTLEFAAMGSQPDIAYVVTRNGGDKKAVYEFNLRSKSLGRLVFQHPKVDVDGVAMDAAAGQAVGTAYTVDHPSAEYFDRSFAQLQADVAATFPGEHVNINSVTSDRKKAVVRVEGAQNPTGTYYLADMTEPSIGKIGARYGNIAPSDIGQVKSISYQARDGLTIPAYLTLPPGSPGKNLPLVVMPHGGPRARDNARFDPWAQFLASRGYAVLQPNFRGSTGYGAQFLEAGRKKWGLEMQNDISDGVKHLIANGMVDAAKVCIYGWSYGGYAAMAGLALTPDYYRCGVAGAGISDLLLFIGDRKRRSVGAARYWADDIGSTISDHDRLVATSPIKQVRNIRAPLLLIHPKDDVVVPLHQSSLMAKAMQDAGKPVEYIELEGDDHWLSKASTSKRVLRELERFLGQHLK